MKLLNEMELVEIEGGVQLSGNLLNSFGNVIKILLEVGRSLGSSLRRLQDNNVCRL